MGQEAKAMGECDLVFNFSTRGVRDLNEPRILSCGLPSAAFNDVRWNRNSGSAELRSETELLVSRKRTRELIDKENQFIGELKRSQLSVIAHREAEV